MIFESDDLDSPQPTNDIEAAVQRIMSGVRTYRYMAPKYELNAIVQMEKIIRAELGRAPAAPMESNTTWCTYIAGMIETYLQQNPAADVREEAIAGIIERRLRFLATQQAPSGQQAEPVITALSMLYREAEAAGFDVTSAAMQAASTAIAANQKGGKV